MMGEKREEKLRNNNSKRNQEIKAKNGCSFFIDTW
jgi:hypothetical protein